MPLCSGGVSCLSKSLGSGSPRPEGAGFLQVSALSVFSVETHGGQSTRCFPEGGDGATSPFAGLRLLDHLRTTAPAQHLPPPSGWRRLVSATGIYPVVTAERKARDEKREGGLSVNSRPQEGV